MKITKIDKKQLMYCALIMMLGFTFGCIITLSLYIFSISDGNPMSKTNLLIVFYSTVILWVILALVVNNFYMISGYIWKRNILLKNKIQQDVLEELKSFALGLNGEDHVDTAIKNCPCDACRIVKKIIEEEWKNK